MGLLTNGSRLGGGLAIAAGIAVAALLAGCYQPTLRDCTVTCAAADDCAGDQICGPDGYCALPEVAGSCGDGGELDAAADADPTAPDADPSRPDAAIPDAGTAPDASGPLVLLKVRIIGTGRVVSDALDISCDVSCNYNLPMGTVVTLSPVVTDQASQFSSWTQACAGQTPDCTLTLNQAMQTARAVFGQ